MTPSGHPIVDEGGHTPLASFAGRESYGHGHREPALVLNVSAWSSAFHVHAASKKFVALFAKHADVFCPAR